MVLFQWVVTISLTKKRLNELSITFTKRPPIKNHSSRKADEYLVLNGPGICSSKLRKKLIKEGIKENKCEECGQEPNWNGKELKLHLDHINGDRSDNRLINLRILCPHCHSQTSTYAKIKTTRSRKEGFKKPVLLHKKIRRSKNHRLKKVRKCECGEEIQNRNKTGLCKKCYREKFPPPRKVSNRPPLSVLTSEINELGYKGVGRKYGVSDNAVRKWVKTSHSS